MIDLKEMDVRTFMRTMGQDLPDSPLMDPDPALIDLRMALITEEFDETIDAMIQLKRQDLTPAARLSYMAEVLDGVIDLMYVSIGACLALGMSTTEAWAEVQRANMEKANGPIREDGKRLKPEGWVPPNIVRIVREMVAETEFADRSIT